MTIAWDDPIDADWRRSREALQDDYDHLARQLEDCHLIDRLVRITPDISLHIPWDEPEDPAALRAFAAERGLTLGTTNSNTFEDQPGQARSY